MATKSNKFRKIVEVEITAEVKFVGVVRAAIHEAIKIAGVPDEQVDSMVLALDEAVCNVITHGYGGACGKPIIVRLAKLSTKDNTVSGLELTVRDFGKQIDPTKIKGRDLEDVRPGGLGVHIIRSVMDEVEYSCPLDGGMQLRMVKYFDTAKKSGKPAKTEHK